MVNVSEDIEKKAEASPCQVCSAKSRFRCSSCRSVYYCGRSHQTLDWKTHRSVCRVRQALEEIKKAKHHRADVLLKRRNSNRPKRQPASSEVDEDAFIGGVFRPRHQPTYPSLQALAFDIIKDLAINGFSVIDDFVDASVIENVRAEIQVMKETDMFLPGRLCQTTRVVGTDVRGDMVKWLDVRHDCPYTAIHSVIRKMDRVTQRINAWKKLSECDIRSRSPVMIAYYPENSPGYKQHVDNPSNDGRKLTFILYMNKQYDKKQDGGQLRIHKRDRGLFFDIEPIDGRLVIFWSDSRTPHEVLPTNRDRLALSVWYFDLLERAKTLMKESSLTEEDLLGTRLQP
eukprot:gene13446-4317_t